MNLPEERQESCVFDYSSTQWSWEKALRLTGARRTRATKIPDYLRQGGGRFDCRERSPRDRRDGRVAERLADLDVWKKSFTIELRPAVVRARMVRFGDKITCATSSRRSSRSRQAARRGSAGEPSPPAGSRSACRWASASEG